MSEKISRLWVGAGLKFSPDQNTTVLFNSRAEQESTIKGLCPHHYYDLQFVRIHGTNQVKVQEAYGVLANANYMILENSELDSKLYYCFVISCEYVNDSTCLLTFKIDEMQTYMFDWTLNACYVDREHVADDTPFLHILDEGFTPDIYIRDSLSPVYGGDAKICVNVLDRSATGNSQLGSFIGGSFTGGAVAVYGTTNDNIHSLEFFLQAYEENPEAVQNVYMCPSRFFDTTEKPFKGGSVPAIANGGCKVLDLSGEIFIVPQNDIGGYEFHNNKMQCYPYQNLCIEGINGATLELKFEECKDKEHHRYTFQALCYANNPVQAQIYPTNAEQSVGAHQTLTINGFPVCAWSTDYFQSWFKNQFYPQQEIAERSSIRQELTGLASPFMSAASGNASGVASGVLMNSFNTWNREESINDTYEVATSVAKAKPPTSHGQTQTGLLRLGVSTSNQPLCYAYRVTMGAEQAERIDKYFDRFGYRVATIKVPELHSRPVWNYVKTVDCNLTGTMPPGDQVAIRQIFNKGVTFFHKYEDLNKFNLKNY
nr:MAG TPA: Major tail protein [Caudoviricetes sp.]